MLFLLVINGNDMDALAFIYFSMCGTKEKGKRGDFMQEFKGYGGGKIIIDGETIFIKQAFIKEKCTLADILAVDFIEPTFSKNGSLQITTRKQLHQIFFVNGSRDVFFELYSFFKNNVPNLEVQPEPRPTNTIGDSATDIPETSASSQMTNTSGSSKQYVVLQVVLKEKLIGTGSGNLTELENVINAQAAKGYRLHTITTASSGSKGMAGGDRIQATMVFEKL